MKNARPKRTRLRAAAKACVPSLTDAQVKTIQDRIGHHFKDRDLLVRALTHPSAVAAADSIRLSNQRLEFLGDRVLNLLIAERLIERRKTESEGDLAPRLNRFVKKGACAEAFRHFKLQEYIILSDGEVASGGRERESTLGDACEALIGAIFQDGGLSAARKFVEAGWAHQFSSAPGPDHQPVYEIEVQVPPHGAAKASGTSKRDAERNAAALLLNSLTGTP